ncbi:MAG: hypothetical protein PHO02_07200 [Candidatus Nanoarchaeia archaeon]|nr:hypothetical protein [Candidatus Nanoarchaeia archaeon]
MKMNRKGAIEMSMTTIIVVILGITLLSLGLMFVRNIFSDIGGSSAKMSDLADKQMMEMFGESEDPISLPRDQVEIEQGDEDILDIGIRNTGEDQGKFSLKSIEVVSKPGAFKGDALKWLSWDSTESTILSGKAKTGKILVAVPTNANLGTYQFKITLSCNLEEVCPAGGEPTASFFVKVVS